MTENPIEINKLKHLVHCEDAIIAYGKEGGLYTLNLLRDIANNITNLQTTPIDIKVKMDGSCSMLFGYNPDNNIFFVSTKGLFAKKPKINYTAEDIQQNHGDNPDLVKKLQIALQYLPSVIPTGVYQGDFLYTSSDIQSQMIHEVDYSTFHPNTLIYAIPTNSVVGKRIIASKMGICIHTAYTGNTVSDLKAHIGFNYSELQSTTDVVIVSPELPSIPTSITTTELKQIHSLIQEATDTIASLQQDTFDILKSTETIQMLIERYENSKIRQGVQDMYVDEFIDSVHQYVQKELDSRKTDKGKLAIERTYAQALSFCDSSSSIQDVYKLFKYQSLVVKIKDILIRKLDATSTMFDKYLQFQDNHILPTGEEGFVVTDHQTGITIKLVNRLEFSHANFSSTVRKGWDHTL